MRILYIDIDSLRPDHLGCYGYERDTSPNIDRVAERGTRFTNYYVSDAPCLPSRTALFTGRLGIHTGVINHGGLEADIRPQGEERRFNNMQGPYRSWMTALRQQGIYTALISPFATRHAAWHILDGFREVHDTGKNGQEIAGEVTPVALRWIRDHGKDENWFLHVNVWDPHTPYRTPMEYGNPFEADAAPDWLSEEIIQQHRASYGPHSARELQEWGPNQGRFPRVPADISSRADFKQWIDAYDTGIKYADDHVGQILDALQAEGVLDDTIVIISADHGENQGELNVYGDHQTADAITCRVPLIVAGPGIQQGHVDTGFHYQVDLAPTITQMVGGEPASRWDGQSFLPALTAGKPAGRPYLVTSQGAWACQRGVLFDNWLLLRTYDPGLKDFPDIMLFDLEHDPHETKNLADERPEIVNQGIRLLEEWYTEMMQTSTSATDPMWHVIREGGPLHARGRLEFYQRILRETGREDCAERLEQRYKPK